MKNNITEDYVSFETARLLKEKGFDVPVYTYYTKAVTKTTEEQMYAYVWHSNAAKNLLGKNWLLNSNFEQDNSFLTVTTVMNVRREKLVLHFSKTTLTTNSAQYGRNISVSLKHQSSTN